MAEGAGSFVQGKLNITVPWNDLVGSDNLRKVLHAIVQRLDRHDQALVAQATTGSTTAASTTAARTTASAAVPAPASGFTIIANSELEELRQRLSVVENTSLQNRIAQLTQESALKGAAAKAQAGFRLADHVIPLTQLKSRLEACEVRQLTTTSTKREEAGDAGGQLKARDGVVVEGGRVGCNRGRLPADFHRGTNIIIFQTGIKANAEGVDGAHQHIAKVAEALHKELTEALEKMATKEELRALEARVDELQAKVDAFEAKFEEIERKLEALDQKIATVAAEVAKLDRRVGSAEDRLDQAYARLRELTVAMQGTTHTHTPCPYPSSSVRAGRLTQSCCGSAAGILHRGRSAGGQDRRCRGRDRCPA
jgi:tetrahydromethanopterin S-methyltransferase subunit G